MKRLLVVGIGSGAALVFACGVAQAEPPPASRNAPSAQEAPRAPPGDTTSPSAPTLRDPESAPQSGPRLAPTRPHYGWNRQRDEISEGKPTRRRWYGWQTLISDGIGLGLLAGGASSDSDAGATLGISGMFVYGLGTPIIHGAHGHVGRAFGSLALHLGLPYLGLLVGAGTASCDNSSSWTCEIDQGVVGLFIGAVAASAIDATVLAYDEVPEEPTAHAAFRLRVAPLVAPRSGRYGLEMIGSF